MSQHNRKFVPAILKIAFSKGEIATYEKRRDEEISKGKRLAQFIQPKYDFVGEKIEPRTFEALRLNFSSQQRSFEQQYRAAVKEVKRLFSLDEEAINVLHAGQQLANEQTHSAISKEMFGRYKSLKNNIKNKAKILEDPLRRNQMMAGWLRETGIEELAKTEIMLEFETDFIVEKVNSPRNQWSCFLSHIQDKSMYLCRLMKENLERKGMKVWLNKSAERMDLRGMVNGIIYYRALVIVLTEDYFKRQYCVFEYCIAKEAGKPVINVLESDERIGGGSFKSFEIVGMFKHRMKHEIIAVSRRHGMVLSMMCIRGLRERMSRSQLDVVKNDPKMS